MLRRTNSNEGHLSTSGAVNTKKKVKVKPAPNVGDLQLTVGPLRHIVISGAPIDINGVYIEDCTQNGERVTVFKSCDEKRVGPTRAPLVFHTYEVAADEQRQSFETHCWVVQSQLDFDNNTHMCHAYTFGRDLHASGGFSAEIKWWLPATEKRRHTTESRITVTFTVSEPADQDQVLIETPPRQGSSFIQKFRFRARRLHWSMKLLILFLLFLVFVATVGFVVDQLKLVTKAELIPATTTLSEPRTQVPFPLHMVLCGPATVVPIATAANGQQQPGLLSPCDLSTHKVVCSNGQELTSPTQFCSDGSIPSCVPKSGGGEVATGDSSDSSDSSEPQCMDSNGDGKDLYDNGCSWYVNRKRSCGQFDDSDFKAKTMCCTCKPPAISKLPDPEWLLRRSPGGKTALAQTVLGGKLRRGPAQPHAGAYTFNLSFVDDDGQAVSVSNCYLESLANMSATARGDTVRTKFFIKPPRAVEQLALAGSIAPAELLRRSESRGWYGNMLVGITNLRNDNVTDRPCPCANDGAFLEALLNDPLQTFACKPTDDRPEHQHVVMCALRTFNDRKGEWATVTLGVPSLTAVTFEEHQTVEGSVTYSQHNPTFDPEIQSKAITHSQQECQEGDLDMRIVQVAGVCGSSFGLKIPSLMVKIERTVLLQRGQNYTHNMALSAAMAFFSFWLGIFGCFKERVVRLKKVDPDSKIQHLEAFLESGGAPPPANT